MITRSVNLIRKSLFYFEVMLDEVVDSKNGIARRGKKKNGKSTLMMVMIIRLKIRFCSRGKRIEFDWGIFCRMD